MKIFKLTFLLGLFCLGHASKGFSQSQFIAHYLKAIKIKDRRILFEEDAVRKVAAILGARSANLNFSDFDLPANTLEQANDWVINHLKKDRKIGTTQTYKKDYDFDLLQWTILLHKFGRDTTLLKPAASRKIVFQGLKSPPHVGNKRLPLTIFRVNIGIGSLAFPETENHVLMSATWTHLINQWIEENPLNDYAIKKLKEKHPKLYINTNSVLEDQLLSVLARIVQNGYFETNARAYQSFSALCLLALGSYSNSPSVKLSAQAGVEYTFVKLIYQSHKGVRYPPARRNWQYRNKYGLLQSDYLPIMAWTMGMDFPQWAKEDQKLNSGRQWNGFGLWTVLSNYQLPQSLVDLSYNPIKKEHSFYTKAQVQYTHRHYLQGKWPRYSVGKDGKNKMHSPDLRSERIFSSPEFYWGTTKYTLSSGGSYSRYSGLKVAKWADKQKIYDFLAKPTLLISDQLSNFKSPDQAKDLTLFASENSDPYYRSQNTGLYKNLLAVRNYDTKTPAISIPQKWIESSHESNNDFFQTNVFQFKETSPLKGFNAYMVSDKKNQKAILEFLPQSKHNYTKLSKLANEYLPNRNKYSWTYRSIAQQKDFQINFKTNIYWSATNQSIHYEPKKANKSALLEVFELDQNFKSTHKYYAKAYEFGFFEYGLTNTSKRIWDLRDYKHPKLLKP